MSATAPETPETPEPPAERPHQVLRLARLLGVEADDVEGLDDVPEAELRALHDQIGEAIYGPGRPGFARVAGLASAVPGPLAATMAERFLPPVLAARVAESLEPRRAADLVGRIRVDYLADVAVALDPVAAGGVVRALPPSRIAAVAEVLFARGEHLAMAEFVTAITPEALEVVAAQTADADLEALVPYLSEELLAAIAELA